MYDLCWIGFRIVWFWEPFADSQGVESEVFLDCLRTCDPLSETLALTISNVQNGGCGSKMSDPAWNTKSMVITQVPWCMTPCQMVLLNHVYFILKSKKTSTGSSSANVFFNFLVFCFSHSKIPWKGSGQLLGGGFFLRPRNVPPISEDWHWNLFDIFLVLTDAWNWMGYTGMRLLKLKCACLCM